MKRFVTTVLILSAACFVLRAVGAPAAEKCAGKGPMLAHNVFFSLEDSSAPAKKALVEDCHKYLAPIKGIVFYAAGVVADLKRPVNDRDYDVALHIVFENRAALDKYMVAPKHLALIKKHKANWKKVRVFDSVVGGAK